MSDHDTPEENRQFEDMLHRLDALMKRNQPSETSRYEFEVETSRNGEDTATQEPDETSDDEIPVLTDVYQGDAAALADAPASADSGPDMQGLSASLEAAIENIIRQETDKMRRAVLERLPEEIAAAIRLHFRQD